MTRPSLWNDSDLPAHFAEDVARTIGTVGIMDFGQIDDVDGIAIAQVTVSENGRAKVGSYSVGRDYRKPTALHGPS
ncbi:MAG TPA: hypothetical protein VFH31_00485 [Pyrinomonadaceae bacterium]|nr:hypothetical protein [Pyrinomonadaceae bacterium]